MLTTHDHGAASPALLPRDRRGRHAHPRRHPPAPDPARGVADAAPARGSPRRPPDRPLHALSGPDRRRAASAVAAAHAAFDPAQLGVWPLRLGHAWSAFGEFTVSLLRSWMQEYPEVPLELRRIEDRTAGLARGEVDAALLRGPVTTPGIRTEPLMMEPRLAAVPAGPPLAARSRLPPGARAAYPVAR